MTDEDRQRAGRIAVLSGRLWRLEELLKHAGTGTGRGVAIGPQAQSATPNGIPPVVLLGVEAERLLAHMIDELQGELQALL